VQSGVTVAAAVSLTREPATICGNDEAMEREENQRQVFLSFHSLLEISQRQRDSHIPTASATSTYPRLKPGKPRRTGDHGKVEIQNQDSHFSTAANRLRRKVEQLDSKTKKGVVLPCPSPFWFQDHLVLESESDFSSKFPVRVRENSRI
jgi:hypothetical protein